MSSLSKIHASTKLRVGAFFVIYTVLLFFTARLTITGLDGKASVDSVIALTLFLIFLTASKKSFCLLLPVSTIFALYAPIGFEYGAPSFQYVISLLATDASEAGEFLALIPTKHYFKALAIPVLLSLSYFVAKKGNLRPWRNKLLITISLCIFVVLLNPIQFFGKLQSTIDEVQAEKQKLASFVTHNDWGQSIHQGQPKDYVLVIGESVRRDYMHIYGYPVENTPFLDKAPAVIVDGLYSAGTYTIGSLRLMLTLSDKNWQPNYSLNIIDLAKNAGFKTYWISNQGYLSQDDTPISAIGNQADYPIFLNKSSYYSSRYSDFKLLEILNSKLEEKAEGSRLFVLHTLGSHPNVCRRIEEMKDPFKVTDKKLEYVGCYVSSIKYTDQLLETLYTKLKNNQKANARAFSILYFSDHGLAHREDKGRIVINNNLLSRHHYFVPLILLDSEISERKYLTSEKLGLFFADGLSSWLGISNEKLSGYDLFDGVPDVSLLGLDKKIKSIQYEDPAIDITNVLLQN